MSFRGGFYPDFFEEEPFGRMERMMNSMFEEPIFMGAPLQRQQQQQQQQQHLQRMRQEFYDPRGRQDGPIIEEVDNSVEQAQGNWQRSSGPIIEEPEEEGNYGNYLSHPSSTRQHPRSQGGSGASGVRINVGSGGIPEVTQYGNGVRTMLSYSSSSSSYGGAGRSNPVVYSSSSTTRIGPGGVRETTSNIRDGRTGQESVTISRAIGERGRTITRTRDAQGHEESRDLLNNINVHDTAAFDQEWMHHATHSLPGNTENQRRSRRQRLEY